MELIQFSPEKVHVYGHQDDTTRSLTNLEQLNCTMDSDAKQFTTSYIEGNVIPTSNYPSDLGFDTITCGSHLVTPNTQFCLYKTVTHNNMLR